MRSKRTKGRILPKVMSSALAIALVVTSLLSGAGTVTVKAAGADEQVAAFVERMYTEALGRASEPDGKADWTSQLLGHASDGARLAEGFIRSAEFQSRGLSDEDYLKTLYKTFFDREPDEGGYNNWLGLLKAGTSRENVLSGFVDSAEFANLCVSFGISQGYMSDNGVVANPGIGLFVYRLYDTLLGRTPDGGGLFDWTMKIATNQFSAAQVATESFILSQEFQQRQEGMTDSAYLDTLYATFFGRQADEGGKSYWLQQLSWGAKRTDIVYGFAGAEEFKNLQAGYGLEIKETPAYEVVAEPQMEEDEAGWWQSVADYTYVADGTQIGKLEYQYSEDGKYLGYKEYEAYQDADGVYRKDMQLTYEYTVTYNADGNRAMSETKSYSFKEDGTTYLDRYSYNHYDGSEKEYVTKYASTYYSDKGAVTSTSEEEYVNGVCRKSASKSYYYDNPDRLSYESSHEYNENGDETKSIYKNYYYENDVQYLSNEETRTTSYNGDKKSSTRVINKYRNGANEDIDEREVTYEYQGDNLVKAVERSITHDVNYSMTTYSYDKNGHAIDTEYYHWRTNINSDEQEGEWHLDGWIERKYDINGNNVESVNYTSEDGTKNKYYISNKTIRDYVVIDGYSRMRVYDYYYDSSKYDPENYKYSHELKYDSGWEYTFDEHGYQTYYKSYTSNENGEKALDWYTKYLEVTLPGAVPAGTRQLVRSYEDYNAEDTLLRYTEEEYIYMTD